MKWSVKDLLNFLEYKIKYAEYFMQKLCKKITGAFVVGAFAHRTLLQGPLYRLPYYMVIYIKASEALYWYHLETKFQGHVYRLLYNLVIYIKASEAMYLLHRCKVNVVCFAQQKLLTLFWQKMESFCLQCV